MASIRVERNIEGDSTGRVVVVRLQRPASRNALSSALVAELLEAVHDLGRAQDCGAIVLAAEGSVFCAGGDLKEGLAVGDGFLEAHRGRGAYAELLLAILRSPRPVVAAVDGDAMGGGLGLAAACDVVIAGREARFGTPELRLGLFPWIISVVLQREVPRKRLSELILTGGRWSAEEASSAGLITRVVDPGDAETEAVCVASRMASYSPAVVAMGKTALNRVTDLPLEAGLAHMHDQLSLNLLTDDAAEGIEAFLQRRPPSWKGR